MQTNSFEKEVMKMAIDKYGLFGQLQMTQEECAELIVASSHFMRGRINEDELIEEIADVKNMIEQLAIYFGHDKIEKVRIEKLKRIHEKMKEE